MLGKSYSNQKGGDVARDIFLNYCFEESKDKKLLDIGCGDGEVTLLLAKHFDYVIGIDKKIRDNEKDNVKFYTADFTEELDFLGEREIDLVISCFNFHIMKSVEIIKGLNNIKRYMKKDGMLIFVIPNPITFFAAFNLQNSHALYHKMTNREIDCTIMGRDGKPNKIKYVHHTITEYLNILEECGFKLVRSNSKKTLLMKDSFDDRNKFQNFLIIKAVCK